MAIDKIIRYIYYGVIAILAIVALTMIFKGTDEDPNVDFSLWQGIVYTAISVGIVAFFAVVGLIFNFKSNLKAIIAVVVMVAGFYILKGMADTDVPRRFIDEGINVATLTSSEAGVMISVVMLLAAGGITIAAGVRGLFE